MAFFNADNPVEGGGIHHLPPWGVGYGTQKGGDPTILGVGENGNKTLTLYPKYGMRADFFQTLKLYIVERVALFRHLQTH